MEGEINQLRKVVFIYGAKDSGKSFLAKAMETDDCQIDEADSQEEVGAIFRKVLEMNTQPSSLIIICNGFIPLSDFINPYPVTIFDIMCRRIYN